MATVKLFGNLRSHVDGKQLQIPGVDVRAVLMGICEGQPSLCDLLLEEGEIRPHFKITLNGHDIQLAHGLNTAVGEDDQIAIFPPIAGG
jgi:molybdopterin synthase sulfur carrier subunit